jgi:hypothetical protein
MRDALQGFLRLGAWLTVCGGLMALLLPRDSGEFVLSVCSAMMGIALLVGTSLLIRRSVRRDAQDAAQGDFGDDWPQ